jgi:hypothetical protein
MKTEIAILIAQGDVPVDGYYWRDGTRYQRIGLSSVRPVDDAGNLHGVALALIPDEPVDRIEDQQKTA